MPRLSRTRKELLTTAMKQAILEATTSVLCEHGVDGTTMNRVAAAANVGKSSLYDYFPSKDELLEFVSERIVAPFVEAVEQTVAGPLPAPRKLATILQVAFEHSNEHKALIRLLEQKQQRHEVRQRVRPRILEALTTVFEQGIHEGAFHSHNPAHTGRMFLGCLSELMELQSSNASDEVTREYVEVLVQAVLHGLSLHVRPGDGGTPRTP